MDGWRGVAILMEDGMNGRAIDIKQRDGRMIHFRGW